MAQSKRYVFSVEVTVESDLERIEDVKKFVLRMLSSTLYIFFQRDRRSVKIEKIDIVEFHQEGITPENNKQRLHY